MAATLAFCTKHVFLPILIIICILAHQFHLTIAKPISTGFSLKLVHRDSPESPFYPGNLSYFHQMQRLINLSETRYLELQSRSTRKVPSHDFRPDIIRPRVGTIGNLYFVPLDIGTPSKPHMLALDTGSSLIWIQCQPCNDQDCFEQDVPIFDPKSSSSFSTVPCSHPLCKGMKCIDGRCTYSLAYGGGQTSKGYISNETFKFDSSTGAQEVKDGMVFGCSNKNQHFKDFHGEGILGMDVSKLSLIGQIRDKLTNPQFSYCLVPPMIRRPSFLRFGDDIKAPRGGRVQTTPFVRTSYPLFALTLLDISVGNNRIRFPPGAFAPKRGGTGGCFIDSGSTITFMDAQPYREVKRAIMQHFEQYHLQTVQSAEGYDLCYRLPGGFNDFPKVTFHFQNADLQVMPENMFYIFHDKNVFCLGMKPAIKGKTVIGAMQQQNTRFVYQLAEDKLSFYAEDCSQDMG